MQVEWDGDETMTAVTIRRPSNFHAHGRRDALMRAVAPVIMRHQRYVLWMPNNGPIRTIDDMLQYHEELRAISSETIHRPIDFVMTLYLTGQLTPDMIGRLSGLRFKTGVKYYPPEQGATTGSGFGIPLGDADLVLSAMQDEGIPLLGHFESVLDVNGRTLDPALREGYMVDNFLWKLRDKYPRLRICFEHASTAKAVEFVKADTSGNTVMTITPQHSLFIAPDFDDETLGTHLKCMPIVKTADDRAAVLAFMTSGDARVIAGDDTAPHPEKTKTVEFDKAANGCWLPHSIALYAKAFERAGELARSNKFETFMSLNGPSWWGLPAPTAGDTVTVERTSEYGVPAPTLVPKLDDMVVPLGWTDKGPKFDVGWRVRA